MKKDIDRRTVIDRMCIAGNGLYRYFGDCKGWWLCTGAHYRVGGIAICLVSMW